MNQHPTMKDVQEAERQYQRAQKIADASVRHWNEMHDELERRPYLLDAPVYIRRLQKVSQNASNNVRVASSLMMAHYRMGLEEHLYRPE